MRILGFEIQRTTKASPPVLQGIDSNRGWMTIFESSPGAWQRDETLDQSGLMANWCVFACVTLIAGDVGKLPIKLMRPEGDVWKTVESAAFSPVLRKPNDYQTRQKFLESWILSKLTNGNAYILKERDARGVVVRLHVLDPSRVRPLVAPNGDVYYELIDDELAGVTERMPAVPASEIIHDRMWCLFHPLVGLSPIFASALAATQGTRIQKNSAKFFENMSRPSGVLTAPGQISDPTAARLKAHWEANFSGDKIGKVAVLGDGLKYDVMSITPLDAQLVDQLKLTGEIICSTYHVPGYKVGVGPMPTYQNAEVLNQIYYSDCLQVLIEAAEALLDEGLGLTAAGYGAEFDLDALLRMDSATHTKMLNEAVGGGWMAPNEARQRRNLPPVTGGETPYLQQQNYALAALAKRDNGEDPFGKTPAASPAAATVPAVPTPEADDTDDEEIKSLVVGHLLRKGHLDA